MSAKHDRGDRCLPCCSVAGLIEIGTAAEPPAQGAAKNDVPAALPAKPTPLTPEQEERLREAEQLNRQVYDLWKAGRSREALPLAQEALTIRQQILGLEHKDTAQSLFNLGRNMMLSASTPRPNRSTAKPWRSVKQSWARTTPTMPTA